MDKLYTPRELSRMYGRTITEGYIREACRRAPDEYPLPHIVQGRQFRISVPVFEDWLRHEMRATVGMAITKTMAVCLPVMLLLGAVL